MKIVVTLSVHAVDDEPDSHVPDFCSSTVVEKEVVFEAPVESRVDSSDDDPAGWWELWFKDEDLEVVDCAGLSDDSTTDLARIAECLMDKGDCWNEIADEAARHYQKHNPPRRRR